MEDKLKSNIRIGELPFYDFILLGHSSVGKTTYLTIMCLEGGKNKNWNFRYGGTASCVKFLPDYIKKDKNDKKKFAELVYNKGLSTQVEINRVVGFIKEAKGSYSTQTAQELIFSFRPAGIEKEHTLLTLDYPGEWLSKDFYNERIKEFVEAINMSHSLIIMIDPTFFEKDIKDQNTYVFGLGKVPDYLKTVDRPSGFVPIKEMPVAVIINKADLLDKKFLKMNPKSFLKEKCISLYNVANNLSKNWEAFFVSCYGEEQKIEKLGESGAYTPPPIDSIRPMNLSQSFEWISNQQKKRTTQQYIKKGSIFVIFLLLIYALIFAWDFFSFSAIEKKIPALAGEPAALYESYTSFENLHIASLLTGFKKRAHEKRKYWVNEYLKLKIKQPQELKISDFKGIITQLEQWLIDIEDHTFSVEIKNKIREQIMPHFEKCYSTALFEQSERDIYEKEFKEFLKFFPESAQLPFLNEKYIYIKIYNIANNLDAQPSDFNQLVQHCYEYLNLSHQHSNKYHSSVQRMLAFINEIVNDSHGNITPKEFKTALVGVSISESMLGTHEESYSVQVPDGWGKRTEWRTRSVFNNPEVRIVVIVNKNTIFQSSTGKSTNYSLGEAFSFDWMPGEEITVKVENFTGKNIEIKSGGFFAINLLFGELNISNEAIIKFSGRKFAIPSLAKP